MGDVIKGDFSHRKQPDWDFIEEAWEQLAAEQYRDFEQLYSDPDECRHPAELVCRSCAPADRRSENIWMGIVWLIFGLVVGWIVFRG